jgi:hypothetical protein
MMKGAISADRSLFGLDKEKRQFAPICASCVKPQGHIALLGMMGKAMQKKVSFGSCLLESKNN